MASLPTTPTDPRVALIQQVFELGVNQQELTSILLDDRPSTTSLFVSIQENLGDIQNIAETAMKTMIKMMTRVCWAAVD